MTFLLELIVDTFSHDIEEDENVVTLAIVDNTGIHRFGEIK